MTETEHGFDRAARLIKEARSSLDPSKVKAGDTAKIRSGSTVVGGVVTQTQFQPRGVILWFDKVPNGYWVNDADDAEPFRLVEHQPAPEPEPEWKPGTIGTAGTVRGVTYTGPVVRTDEHLLPWWTPSRVDGAHYHGEDMVTDFVTDEPRPLPTRDELAKEITRGTRRSADATATLHEVNGHAAADRVLDLLDGAS